MKIEISKEQYNQLVHLGKTYFVVRGTKPMKPEKVLSKMIEEGWNSIHPREYVSTVGRGD